MHFHAFLVQFLRKRGLFQTILLCHCQVLINNQFHFKILQVSNKSILRKLHKYGKRGNFGYFRSNFRANENFPKLAHYAILKY